MGQSTRDVKLEKLTDSNYPAWAFKMENFLAAHDLEEFIGENAALLIANENERVADNKKKDRKALAFINLHISDSLIASVRGKATAKAAWDALKTRFQTAGLAKEVYIRSRFFDCKMREGSSVIEHVDRMQTMIDELAAINVTIGDRERVTSLPKSYAHLIVALESRSGD